MAPTLTRADEGKPVVSSNGQRIGTVERVENEEVWIDPGPDATHSLREAGWDVPERDGSLQLQPDAIVEATDDEVRLDYEL